MNKVTIHEPCRCISIILIILLSQNMIVSQSVILCHLCHLCHKILTTSQDVNIVAAHIHSH